MRQDPLQTVFELADGFERVDEVAEFRVLGQRVGRGDGFELIA